MNSQTEAESSPPMGEFWEAREAGSKRALHLIYLLVEADGSVTILDTDGWSPSSAVQAVLGAAGFTNAARGGLTVVERDPREVKFEPVRGFRFPAAETRKIQVAARTALAGSVGGFRDVVVGAVGFHNNPLAFDMVWEAAGRPPVVVRGADLADAGGDERATRTLSDSTLHIQVDLIGDGEDLAEDQTLA
ncbi:MAG: hypothetical protein IPK82_28100 [Polyangiaceae bacterium]|nr:hypothetical protein [Polyangiaceae bacterium]